jgi:hypothetical protein
MPAMSWEQDPIAFAKLAIFTLTLDAQARRTLDHEHPFIGVLIVPLAFRRRLTGRDDALDAQALALDKQVHDLIWQGPSR